MTLRVIETPRPEKRVFIALDDYGDDIIFNIVDKNGGAFNLTGITPRFKVWRQGSLPFVDVECIILDALAGQCKWNRKETEITKAGAFVSKVLLKSGSTKKESTERLLLVVQQ